VPLINHASYPGVASVLDCSYTCSLGISPGTVTMRVPPYLSGVGEYGDVVISDGVGTVTLRDCKLERVVASASGGGQEATLVILDRRWRFQFAEPLFGRYNLPAERYNTVDLLPAPLDPNTGQPVPRPEIPADEEPIREDTKKTARELAQLCLDAMGEEDADITAIDDEAYPTVEWDATNPAQALQSLAEDFGCRFVYDPVTDQMSVQKLGEGPPLPEGLYLQDSPSLEARPRPNKVRLYGARTRYQLRFELTAVGIDFDNSVRLIDDLSYAPTVSGGWEKSGGGPGFANIPADADLPGERTQLDAAQLAASSVYRIYQITLNAPDGSGGLVIPPPKEGETPDLSDYPTSIRQIKLLPFANLATQDDTGRYALTPAKCYGIHTPQLSTFQNRTTLSEFTDEDTEVQVDFTIDPARGLVIFSEGVYQFTEGVTRPADIVLECACEYAEAETHQYRRYTNEKPLIGGGPDGVASFIREEVLYRVSALYEDGEDARLVTDVIDNEEQIEPRAEYYMLGKALEYEQVPVQDRTYPGIKPVSLSGLVQQVSWSVGGGSESNPSTRASANGEHSIYLPTYGGRRRIEETNFEETKRAKQERAYEKRERAEGDYEGGEF
jgi:hypothetical protein